MDIKLLKQVENPDGKKISRIQMNKSNETFITNEELKRITKNLIKKKRPNQQMSIRMLTTAGWLTFLSMNEVFDDDKNYMEEYIDGRVKDATKFSDLTSQIHITVVDNK